jgi:lysophospholipase L1-like esterase
LRAAEYFGQTCVGALSVMARNSANWPRRSAVALLAVASVLGNVALVLALHASFVKLQFSRIFPLGHANESMSARPPAGLGRSIAFWGDSRSAMWDKAELQTKWRIVDEAHGGTTSSQLRLLLQTLPPNRTDFSVVQIGINDLHPLGALSAHKAEILKQLRLNIVAIREALLERSDVVIFTTIIPPGPVPLLRRAAWDPLTPEYLREFNQVIRDATDGRRVVLLDASAVLSGADARLEQRYADPDFFLHVNREGYATLNAALMQVLERPRLPSN